MSDPLGPRSVLSSVPTLLPRSTSSPLPRPTDAIAGLVHAIHASLGFRLVNQRPANVEGSDRVEQDVDDGASETETAVNEDEEPNAGENTLNEGWNDRGEDNYSFEYRHAQSSMAFRVRVGRMGGRVQIDATAEDGAPNSISVVLTDLVNPSAFPIASSATGSEASSSSPESPAKTIGFKSVDAVKGFIEQYKRDIIAKLIPGLQVDGYTESIGSDPRNPPSDRPSVNPSPARPEFDPLLDPLHRGSYGRPPNPASIGHNDLDPQGIHPNMGPGGVGGGMYMDFNHPLFDRRRRGDPDLQGGPGGTIQPPGARWDPVGPGYGGEFPRAGGNPLGGMGVGDRDRWGDELPPPGEFGPDLGGFGAIGGPRRPGGPGEPGSMGGRMGPGGFGGLGGGGGRFGGGSGGGFGGGGMFM